MQRARTYSFIYERIRSLSAKDSSDFSRMAIDRVLAKKVEVQISSFTRQNVEDPRKAESSISRRLLA